MTAVRVNDIDRGSIVAAYINGFRRREIIWAFIEYTANQIDYILYKVFGSLVRPSMTNVKDGNGTAQRPSKKQTNGQKGRVSKYVK